MTAHEINVPSEGQARRFYESLSGRELRDVQRLLFDDIEKHPLATDHQSHLTKVPLPVADATNGVLCTSSKYFFYYYFPEPGIISVVVMGRGRPAAVDVLIKQRGKKHD